MAIFKCKMCGGDLGVTEGLSVAECQYCGTKQTVSKSNDEVVSNLFNRANNLRLKCEFDKAEQVYEKILDINNDDSEAHWGLVLCKYGIEYVEDPKTYKRVPTCHRTLYEAVLSDVDYLAAVENADTFQKELYLQEATLIDTLQKDILNIVNNEKPFDVFICYKETDENGKRTIDSSIANDIYYQLTSEGFKVFYAAITLEDKLGQEYEPYIFAALNSAKVMLVVGTKPQYFDAVWVRNEWSRFLKLMKTDRSKLLIPCYRDMDAYELPDQFAHLQSQDMSKIGFINDIVRGIKKVVTKSQEPVRQETVVMGGNANADPLIKRAFIFLEDGDWNSANEYCEKVLDIDPECAQAYLGKLMAELHIKKQEYLQNLDKSFESNPNYVKIIRYADDTLKNELIEYINNIKAKAEDARKDSILSEAKSKMVGENIADYEYAIQLLESISGWKDSYEIIATCKNKIADIRAKAEAEQLEKQRQEEITQKEREQIAKRNKKIALITTPIIAVIVAGVILLTTVIIPNSKYNSAIELMEKGKLDDAYTIFSELGNYKDSMSKLGEVQLLYLKNSGFEITKDGYVSFGLYEQDNNKDNGKEPIEWIVLNVNNETAYLLSKYCLDNIVFDSNHESWENSYLFKWLNDEFLNNAFAKSEKNILNSDISLLKVEDVENFLPHTERTAYLTKYGLAKSLTAEEDGKCSWWLQGYIASNLGGNAYMNTEGIPGGTLPIYPSGVRPVICIKLKN